MKKLFLILAILTTLTGGFFVFANQQKTQTQAKAPAKTEMVKTTPVKAENVYGVDLSHHNEVTDWSKVTAKFVYLKATEGTTFKDSKFKSYAKQAKKHGIKVGAYHFFVTTSPAETQFANFKRTVAGHNLDLTPVIDAERQTAGHLLSPAEYRRQVRIFANLCRKTYGKSPIIYCGQAFYAMYFKGYFNDCPYWCGDMAKPAVLPHVMHQKGVKQVPGIIGRVDYDVLNCDLKQLYL